MNIAIEKIRIADNPRVDFGEIEELASSISEHGLLNLCYPVMLDFYFILRIQMIRGQYM